MLIIPLPVKDGQIDRVRIFHYILNVTSTIKDTLVISGIYRYS